MPKQHDPERREYRRFRFPSIIRVHDSGQSHDCRIIDLSLHGFRARCPSGWRPQCGSHFFLEWHVADVIKLELQADVTRFKNGVIGCRWQAEDEQSSAHLQRLVEISRLRKHARERELEAMKARA